MHEDYECLAWKWLLSLPRLDWQEKSLRVYEEQIRIRALPGKLGANSGAPGVRVSVAWPGRAERFRASGNSLWEATQRIHTLIWEASIYITGPSWREPARNLSQEELSGASR